MKEQVNLNYRFLIKRLSSPTRRRFQLRMGMDDEENVELVPVHTTAFAQQLPLEKDHAAEVDAHLELSAVLEWLSRRQR